MNPEEMIDQLHGCFLAVPTLFKEDFSLNLAGIQRHVSFMIENGLHQGNATFLVNGASGEFPVLDKDERRQTAEAVLRVADGRVGIIVGAQTLATLDALEIARHAQAIGATAIQVSPPFYYPPTDDDVYEHVAMIAEAAPDIGIVFYPTWWLGYKPSLDMIERLAAIPQVVAVKWSTPGPVEYQLGLRRFSDRLGMIDNMLLPVASKMQGAIGSNLHPAMFWPEWGAHLWSSLEAGKWNEAQALVDQLLLPYYDLIGEIGTVTGGEGHIDKFALELVGLEGGRNRPPTRVLPPAFKEKLRRLCIEAGAPLNRV
jgi:dihydrodipicolinate synthase/N-acetylneuraminate lyase